MTAARRPSGPTPRRFVLPDPDPDLRYLWVHPADGRRGVCGYAMTRARARQFTAAGHTLRTGASPTSPQVTP